MEVLTGTPFMTLAVSGETIKVEYETAHAVDILNGTDDEISVNTKNEFNGTHFVIPAGSSYNDLHIGTASGSALYIKANGAGNVSIVCGRY